MKRRIRSSPGFSRGAAARAPLYLLVAASIGLTAAACSSDLFHDTKWQSRCDAEPDAAICPQGTGGAAAGSTGDGSTGGGSASSSSASSTASAGGEAATSSAASTASAAASTTSTGTGP